MRSTRGSADERSGRRRCCRSDDLARRFRDGARARCRRSRTSRSTCGPGSASRSSASRARARRSCCSRASACWPQNGRARGSARFEGRELIGASEDGAERACAAPASALLSQDPIERADAAPAHRDAADRVLLDRGLATRGGGAAARARGAARGRDPGARSAAAAVPARALRRHAPARRAGDGAHVRPAAAARGRTDDGARRERAGADPRTAARACATAASAS